MKERVIDLFSCIGCHALGFHRAGLSSTVAMVEKDEFRRSVLARRLPNIALHSTVEEFSPPPADIVFGGPPCKETSVAAAIHNKRTGFSLWPEMLRIGINAGAEWIVVEQPPGHSAWEAEVCNDLSKAGFHVARLEFGACDLGAPYIRRRVYLVACTSLSRLEVAWREGPRAIEAVARAANARGAWDPGKLRSLRVDARSAGEMERSKSALRRSRLEALGDSNPPEMAEVIGMCIASALTTPETPNDQ
ncbi:hypothetical protein GTA62_14860 [Roseobacter sp. HKCCD9010]|uniref:DNA cytosine methyltransferase n=1 Tax=unclassified Roseobacter TaxID=196798 RepID=UPI001490DD9A|nr:MULTISPECIES: DNA cytosine methyltransferase [unclassified Roseobacter]MBF9050607.1 hypothetical protein [Rhodobacterales bacterium HKCCD4356]NNV11974.1 hypothetical protein [Roseobacter sp. HKCCD7357]NNV16987.1 hypothetical protein [Roseobacter sp. HKCCD8768]NNV26217.1 hypothetical protein [Roseobacter sp. HKCCD8192]NNV30712.1 hypothetical protein [Roseobacter sp. HKCCD9061]